MKLNEENILEEDELSQSQTPFRKAEKIKLPYQTHTFKKNIKVKPDKNLLLHTKKAIMKKHNEEHLQLYSWIAPDNDDKRKLLPHKLEGDEHGIEINDMDVEISEMREPLWPEIREIANEDKGSESKKESTKNSDLFFQSANKHHKVVQYSHTTVQPSEKKTEFTRLKAVVKGPFDYLLQLERIGILTLEEMKMLFVSPIPEIAGQIALNVKRLNSGIGGFFFPKFELSISESHRLLLTSQRRGVNITGNYLITLNPEDLSPKDPSYLGKLRANFWNTEFNLYDAGDNPESSKCSKPRENLAFIKFEHTTKSEAPRRTTVILPSLTTRGSRLQYFPAQQADSLATIKDAGKIFWLKNREPCWSETLKAYILDFKDKAKKPSIKNCILTNSSKDQDYLVFGRLNSSNFFLGIRHPFSIYQAFGVALAILNSK